MLQRILLISLGTVILLFTMWELLWTTLGEGAGPLTRRVSTRLWDFAFQLYGVWPRSRLLSISGVAISLVTVTLWIGLMWLGWTLVFTAFSGTVYDPVADEPASLAEQIYFTGYMLSTLGLGDIQPRGPFWRILTALASLNGLFQITLAVAYIIPLALAATFKRKVATSISCLGKTADDVILNMWNGQDWRMLSDYLQSLTPELALLNQQHLAYPVLHYFHSVRSPEAIGPSLATLDEALTIIEYGLEEGEGPDPGAFHSARRMISDFLQTLDAAFRDMEAETPPAPTLDKLRDAGVPVVSDEDFQECIGELDERRGLLRALLHNDAWTWDTIRAPMQDENNGEETEALGEVKAL